MRQSRSRALLMALTLTAATAAGAQAAGDRWLHVTVDENDGAKVTVNLPLALAEKALPLIPLQEEWRWRNHGGHHGLQLKDLRELWAELKKSPDMTFVTVEEDNETAKVWKKAGTVYVEVRGEGGRETVDVRVPVEVVDALVGGEAMDFQAAIEALVEGGGGELVSVRDRDDHVRVWIDQTPEARSTETSATR